jgi:membrane associated rhomboid family serine protease
MSACPKYIRKSLSNKSNLLYTKASMSRNQAAMLTMSALVAILVYTNPEASSIHYAHTSLTSYKVFTIATQPKKFLTPARSYLGALNRWVEIPPSPNCKNGWSLGTPTCICSPSWNGQFCEKPIKGFTSLWRGWIYPISYTTLARLNFDTRSLAIWDYNDCILGVSVDYLPDAIVEFAHWINLDNITTRWGILELIVFLQVSLYVIGIICRNNDVFEWYRSAFICGPPYRMLTLIGSSFVHLNFFQFLANITGFMHYAPLLYRILGDSSFLLFYAGAAICTCLGGVKWKRVHYGLGGITMSIVFVLCVTRGHRVTWKEDFTGFMISQAMTMQVSPGVSLGAALFSVWVAASGAVPLGSGNPLKMLFGI